MKRKKWVELPSGRWVTSIETKQGHMVCHAWPSGRYEITLSKEPVGRGSVFGSNLFEVKRAALEHAQQIIHSNQ